MACADCKPDVEVTTLEPNDLDILVKKTIVLINTVGPYHMYSTPVMEACAKNGTHYLDVTGESPWVLQMIQKYHQIAKTSHAIMIPQIGIESAPADLLSWLLVNLIRKELSTGTREVIASVHEMKGAPSGGTLATVLGILDSFSLKDIRNASGKWASSPVPGPKLEESIPLASKIFGVRSVPHLGTLTTSITAGPNVSTVQRSWGLHNEGKLYGPRFQYFEYMAVRNRIVGVAAHFALAFGACALLLPPVRWLVKKIVYAPGQGATAEAASKEALEYRAVATADQNGAKPRQALGKLRWDGGLYYLTGVLLAEAAMVILRDDDLVKTLDGGVLTPSMLGQPFIDRLKTCGLVLESGMMS